MLTIYKKKCIVKRMSGVLEDFVRGYVFHNRYKILWCYTWLNSNTRCVQRKKKYKDRYRSENFFETRRKSLSHTFPKFWSYSSDIRLLAMYQLYYINYNTKTRTNYRLLMIFNIRKKNWCCLEFKVKKHFVKIKY